MKAWHFNTKSLPPDQRQLAWEDSLNRLCLPIGEFPAEPQSHCAITCIHSPLGIEFAQIDAGPHEISGSYPNQPPSIWLATLLHGHAQLAVGEQQHQIHPGDMIYGASGIPATLKFTTDSRQLYVKIPKMGLSQRLSGELSVQVGYLPGHRGISRVLSSLLASLAEALNDITAEQLRPVELSLTEFLTTCLAEAGELQSHPSPADRIAGVKADQLHQIFQRIEARLGSADLDPKRIAQEQGVSVRYLQKLFSMSGNTFSGYVRSRRLARCRADLISPLYADLSITEICYRWGFNASSHFSRAFREEFGQSPREYRRTEPTA